ncbi:hypothetical protein [Streptomyces sp. NPDC058247]|uniref:hypothetical protein n=1 Tax=Streptomyces sp. NPDC058247 TaxID=3346401 RepID=UPI0036EC2E74
MTRTEWQWRDEGSGPGHMQRVSVYLDGQVQRTYGDYIEHASTCLDCEPCGGRCEQGAGLWKTYREARQDCR